MKSPCLDVLVVDAEVAVANAIAAHLRRRGHFVRVARGLREALALDRAHVFVCAAELVDGRGLELLAAIRKNAADARLVLVGGLESADDLRAALQLSIAEIVTRPFQMSDLVRAVEGGDRPSRRSASSAARPSPIEREWSAGVEPSRPTCERILRDLLAFAVRQGVTPAVRARALTACSEVLENVLRRAAQLPRVPQAPRVPGVPKVPGVDGPARAKDAPAGAHALPALRIVARCDERDLTVSIHAPSRDLDVDDPSNDEGLARAAALCEALQVQATPGQGSQVHLRFSCAPCEFDDGDVLDLSELDWLPPHVVQRVLDGVRDGGVPICNLSPALAVAVGRLLAGPTPAPRAPRALRR